MGAFIYFFGFLLILNSAFVTINAGSSEENSKSSSSSSEESSEEGNSTAKDLYVIKTIVYEVGILTDVGNDTNATAYNETHEQVDVSFFDPSHNGSVIDLSSIPVPIQTNVSGVSVTGVIPANLGSITLPLNGTGELNASFPIFPNQQFKITHNISTSNSSILSSLPQILGLDKLIKNETNQNSTV